MADLTNVLDVKNGMPWPSLPSPVTTEARILALLAREYDARPAQLGLQWRMDAFLAAVNRLYDAGWCVTFRAGHPYSQPSDRYGIVSLASRVRYRDTDTILTVACRPSQRDLRFMDTPQFARWLRAADAHALASAEAQR